jgi:outer membrane protein assembly factor BamD
LWCAGCGGGGGPTLEPTPQVEDQLSQARAAVERKDYRRAEELLKGYLDLNPVSRDAGEAHYLLGLIHHRRGEWPLAATEFAILINQFPDDARAPDGRYYLALAFWRQARPAPYDQEYTRRALAEFERFLALYPDHPRAEEARRWRSEARDRLAKKAYENGRLYYKLGYQQPARLYFAEVRESYADTRWFAPALLLEAKSWAKEENWERARAVAQELLAANPRPDVAREARHIVEEAERKLAEGERQG